MTNLDYNTSLAGQAIAAMDLALVEKRYLDAIAIGQVAIHEVNKAIELLQDMGELDFSAEPGEPE